MILVSLLAKFHWIHVPLDRDEGTYLYLGKCFIEGYRPYIDFYEIKHPGVFLVFGFFYEIFGNSIVALHIGLAMVQLLSSFVMYSLTTGIFNNKFAGVIARGYRNMSNFFNMIYFIAGKLKFKYSQYSTQHRTYFLYPIHYL